MTFSENNVFTSDRESDWKPIERTQSVGLAVIEKLRGESADKTILVSMSTTAQVEHSSPSPQLANPYQTPMQIDAASDRQWTGRQLADALMNVACALVDRYQLKRGDVVCIRYDTSDYAAILGLAVICTGGVVATVLSRSPYAEVLHMAQRVGPRFLFCRRDVLHFGKQLELDLGEQVVGVAMDGEGGDSTGEFEHFENLLRYDHRGSPSRNLLPRACDDNGAEFAFMSMSSGTTGRPKAIPLTHLNFLMNYGIGPLPVGLTPVFACTSPLGYASGRIFLQLATLWGHKTVILNDFEPLSYLHALKKYRVNSICLSVQSLQSLINHPRFDEYNLSHVKFVFPFGAKITFSDALKALFDKYPQIYTIKQVYGATECFLVSSMEVDPITFLSDPDNCGKLTPGVEAKVVDLDTGLALGPNEQGMLHVRSRFLFLGYYDIRLTKANASCSPLIRDSSIFDKDGFYITGDIVRFSSKGELYVIGRQKEVMYCRGPKKVFPQELEDVISEHWAVAGVCVVGVENKLGPVEHCPRAFIVPTTNCCSQECDFTKLLAETSDKLARLSCSEKLEFKGKQKLSRLSEERRRLISADIMRFVAERVSWEKQLTGGIVILDELPTLKASAKVNKSELKSLTLGEVEVYGDRSGQEV